MKRGRTWLRLNPPSWRRLPLALALVAGMVTVLALPQEPAGAFRHRRTTTTTTTTRPWWTTTTSSTTSTSTTTTSSTTSTTTSSTTSTSTTSTTTPTTTSTTTPTSAPNPGSVDIALSWLPTRYLGLKQWKLDDATVYGGVYVFPVVGSGAPSIRRVDYWVDSARPAAPTEAPTSTTSTAPFDMAGTAPNGEARPWATNLLQDQAFHTVSMRVFYADGSTSTVVARPYVSNAYKTIGGQTLNQVLAAPTTGTLVVPRGRYKASGGVTGTPRPSLLTVTTDGGEVVLDGGSLVLYPQQQHLLMQGRFHERGTIDLAGATDVHLDQWEFQNPGLTKPAKAVKFRAGGSTGTWCDGCRVTNSFFSDTWDDFLYVDGARNWSFSGNRGVRQYDMASNAHFDGVQVSGSSENATVADNDLEANIFVSDNGGNVTGLAVTGGVAHKSTRAAFQTGHTEGWSMTGVTVDAGFTYGRNLNPGISIDPATAGGVTSSATPADPLPGHSGEPYRIIAGTGDSYTWATTQGTGPSATVGTDEGFRAAGMIRPLVVAVPYGTVVTPPAGFAEVGRAVDPSGLVLILFTKTIQQGDPTSFSVAFSASVPYAVATSAYRYQDPTAPWAGWAGSAGLDLSGPGGTGMATAPSVVPRDDKALVLRFLAARGGGTWTPPSSYGRIRANLAAGQDGIALLIFDPVYNDYRTPGPTGVESAAFSGAVPTAGLTAALAPAPPR